MKVLLSAALIAALSVSAAACTVVTDPSSGSSAASPSSSAFMSRQQQVAKFASVNFDRIKQDMSTGQGEYLASLATLIGIESGRHLAFFTFTQEKFAVLFPSDQTTAAEMLAALDREMRTDPRFGQRLALS
ncbi:MAG: DUF3015 domain-containing protein [Candidatus Contendobacter sp.]|jgi:hypothetical protein|nr:DUF3015 family protein [Gammaproteobacteria bacterium]MCC8993042.1 DUF3015 domain-containing protein [Candidatus Contendobacter sp.]